LGVPIFALGRPDEPIAAPKPAVVAATTTGSFSFVGNAGCAAAGCHNANDAPGTPGSEFSTWASADPHAKAYEALKKPESRRMWELLKQPPRPGVTGPEDDALCLNCHAPAGVPAANRVAPYDLRTDGVGCESCHGPASGYRTTHYQADKSAPGLTNTKDLAARVKACADCHVGNANQDVNHDLIAAGHPRLFWEYSAYHDLLPRHWPGEDGGPFAAKAWAVGGIASAQASAELQAARCGDGKPWPELADFNCYACHHDLTVTGNSRFANKGQLTANRWYPGQLKLLHQAGELGAGFAPPADAAAHHGPSGFHSRRADVNEQAKDAAKTLRGWLRAANSAAPPDAAQARAFASAVARADGPRDWDEATQLYLALAAMHRTAPAPGQAELLEKLRRSLSFPRDAGRTGSVTNSPRGFDPVDWQNMLGIK
jgi:hypothetical protein